MKVSSIRPKYTVVEYEYPTDIKKLIENKVIQYNEYNNDTIQLVGKKYEHDISEFSNGYIVLPERCFIYEVYDFGKCVFRDIGNNTFNTDMFYEFRLT